MAMGTKTGADTHLHIPTSASSKTSNATRCDRVLARVLLTAGTTLLAAACSSDGGSSLPPPPTAGGSEAVLASKPTEFPDLAQVPDRPQTSSLEERQQVAEALVADRGRAQYTRDALRGGTEAPAAPPPAAPPPLPKLSEAPAASSASSAMTTASAAPAPLTSSPASPRTITETQSEVRTQELAAVETRPSAPAPRTTTSSTSRSSIPLLAPTDSERTMASAPRSTLPAPVSTYTPRSTPRTLAQSAYNSPAALPSRGARERIASLNELGGNEPVFNQSRAAPLPGSAQAVLPREMVSQYNASLQRPGYYAPSYGSRTPTQQNVATYTPPRAQYNQPQYAQPQNITSANMGGPYIPMMGGAQSYTNSAATQASLPATPMPGTAVFPSRGDEPLRMFFGNGSYRLTAQQLDAIDTLVAQMRSGQRVRIVGHSSSRTGDMPIEEHLRVNLESSQKRANAVVAALINRGVDADQLIIEAKGDAEPVYYEAMPAGENGNRRVEIFLQ